MSVWTGVRRLLDTVEEVVAGIGLVLVVGITVYGIVNRYLLERSAVWAPELAGFIFTWVVFLGASAAWKRNMHISIGIVVRYLPPRARAAIGVVTDLVMIVFLAYATYLALKITISSHSRLSPVMRVPFSYVYASAALAFALMFLRRCVALGQALRRPALSQEA
jgi:TRAP-type C4-dicarboxylate transport system permease small subunit